MSLGPWPMTLGADASNRVSRNPVAVELGARLFESPRLGGGAGVRCASCHEPWRAFTDGRARAFGLASGTRNTPTLFNVAQFRWFGWDGASDTLWGQNIRPLLDAREMDSSAARVAALIRGDEQLSGLYRRAFGRPPPDDDDTVLVDVAKSLAAYVSTLTSSASPFDAYREALRRDDVVAIERYSPAALRGLRLFVGKGGCIECHSGAGFSDGLFHASLIRSTLPDGTLDTGREAGLVKLAHSPYTRRGAFSDLPAAERAALDVPAARADDTSGLFRTPGLREVARTAPYMHDGSVASLCEAVRPHAGSTSAELDLAQRADVVVFLQSLGSAPVGALTEAATFECRASWASSASAH